MVKKIRELNEGGVIRDGNMYVYDEASTGITKKVSHGIVKENIKDYVMEKMSKNELPKKADINLSNINDDGKNLIKDIAEINKKVNVDLSNINEAGKNVIKMYGGGAARYDYSNPIKNLKSGFKAPTDGLFFIEYWNRADWLWCELYVNGVKLYHNGSGGNYGDEDEHESGLIPLSKDDIVTWKITNGKFNAAFFAAK